MLNHQKLAALKSLKNKKQNIFYLYGLANTTPQQYNTTAQCVITMQKCYFWLLLAQIGCMFHTWFKSYSIDTKDNNCQIHPIICSLNSDWFLCTSNIPTDFSTVQFTRLLKMQFNTFKHYFVCFPLLFSGSFTATAEDTIHTIVALAFNDYCMIIEVYLWHISFHFANSCTHLVWAIIGSSSLIIHCKLNLL